MAYGLNGKIENKISVFMIYPLISSGVSEALVRCLLPSEEKAEKLVSLRPRRSEHNRNHFCRVSRRF